METLLGSTPTFIGRLAFAHPTGIGFQPPQTFLSLINNNADRLLMAAVTPAEGASDWVDIGGGVEDESNISCLTHDQGPICFIHGTDGRIYGRQLTAPPLVHPATDKDSMTD